MKVKELSSTNSALPGAQEDWLHLVRNFMLPPLIDLPSDQ